MNCVSPVDSKRCSKLALKNSKFCSEHSARFTKLYLSYKKIEVRLRHLISKTPIKISTNKYRILKLYSCAHKAYKKRNEYRNKAFVPEEHDKGHALRIRYLWELTERCSNTLMKIFHLEKSEEESFIASPKSKTPIKYKDKNYKRLGLAKKIRKKQNKIYDNEETFNTIIPKFIEESRATYNKSVKEYEEKNVLLQNKMNLTYLKDYLPFIMGITMRVCYMLKSIHFRTMTYISKSYSINLSKELFYEFTVCDGVTCKFVDTILKGSEKISFEDPYLHEFLHNVLQQSDDHDNIKWRCHMYSNKVFLIFTDLPKDNVIEWSVWGKDIQINKPSMHDKIFLNLACNLLTNKQEVVYRKSLIKKLPPLHLDIIDSRNYRRLSSVDLNPIISRYLEKGKITHKTDIKIHKEAKNEMLRKLRDLNGTE